MGRYNIIEYIIQKIGTKHLPNKYLVDQSKSQVNTNTKSNRVTDSNVIESKKKDESPSLKQNIAQKKKKLLN